MIKQDYVIADIFMLRAPLLPLSVLNELSQSNDIDEVLGKYYARQQVKEALFLASPMMYARLDDWMERTAGTAADQKRVRNTLFKYLIRMSSRSTPFGMFAGIASAAFGEKNEVTLSDQREHNVFVRPDMQYLCLLSEKLSGERSLRESLVFFPNTSLFPVNNSYRYVEYQSNKEGLRKYKLQSTIRTPELQLIIGSSTAGAKIHELAELLSNQHVDKKQAVEYLHVLIDNQVLVSEMEPGTTGKHYIDDLIDKVSLSSLKNPDTEELFAVHKLVKETNRSNEQERLRKHIEVLSLIKSNHANIPENTLIQADMKLSTESAALSRSIKTDLEQVLPDLIKISESQSPHLLMNFRDAFIRRYGDREVPLLLALDAETGPGYLPGDTGSNDSALLHGLRIPGQGNTDEFSPGRIDHLLKRKLQKTLIQGGSILEIDELDLEKIKHPDHLLPPSFYGMTKMLGRWKKDPEKQLIHLMTLGGSSALNIAARFSNMDEQLQQTLKRIASLEQEEQGDEILAEIVHLPQQRTGNILLRPEFRDFEIPYLGRSSLAASYTISPADLMVSVRNTKVRIRSERLNKYIVPRLSNAHNYTMGSLAVYRFLSDMQIQGMCSSIGFGWGSLAGGYVYLPRVMYKNFILHPASWNLQKYDISAIQKAGSESELRMAIDHLRAAYNIPREVILTVADNELWIDLMSLQSIQLFQNEIKQASHVLLQEFLFDKNDGVVKGNDGSYANEFIFFFHQKGGLNER